MWDYVVSVFEEQICAPIIYNCSVRNPSASMEKVFLLEGSATQIKLYSQGANHSSILTHGI